MSSDKTEVLILCEGETLFADTALVAACICDDSVGLEELLVFFYVIDRCLREKVDQDKITFLNRILIQYPVCKSVIYRTLQSCLGPVGGIYLELGSACLVCLGK